MGSKASNKSAVNVIGIIPARYGSSRFPGKILASIAGKSLIQRTYENALRCESLERLLIATDDSRIYDHALSFGAKPVMTSISCPTGTDRLVEALKAHPEFDDVEIVVNVQGDEPCLDPAVIEQVIQVLKKDPQAVMSTAVVRFKNSEEAANSAAVKCVFDKDHNALYFSRSLIPAGHKQQWQEGVPYYRHIGIYCFRKHFLMRYADLPRTPLQIAEDLEQLKVLENGYRIKVAVVNSIGIDVNLPEDVKRVEEWLCKQNISL